MKRIAVFVYGVLCYALFFGTFLYAIGFIGNVFVPKSIDSGATVPTWVALGINAALLALFAVQHSVMARPAFKKLITKIIPEAAERSTYVLLASACLILLFAQWQPMGGVIWQVESRFGVALLYTLYALGWLTVLITTFLINHFDLFGLRQVWCYLRKKAYQPLRFVTPGPYQYVRHPLYVGWLIVFWSTPTMTAAHLVFALATTVYILIAIQLEERDLLQIHGEDYSNYRRAVPMLLPVGAKEVALKRS